MSANGRPDPVAVLPDDDGVLTLITAALPEAHVIFTTIIFGILIPGTIIDFATRPPE
jgi:hypothetical protein